MDTAVVEGGTSRGWLDDALAALTPEGEGLHPADDSKVGVVFVHGIGSQRPGETLLSWSRSLLSVVAAWSARNGGPYQLVRRANVDYTGTTIPYVEVGLPKSGSHPAQTWVLTEAYWAAQVRPPAIGEMVDWLVLRLVGVRLAFRLAKGIAASLGARVALIESVVLAIAVVAAFVLAIVAFVVSRVLGALPVAWLRRNLIVQTFDYFLGDWFGDVRIMLTDRVQAANVRSNVRRAMLALKSYGCGRIVVIGHSGGTFVSYMTLAERSEAELPAHRLITHGQALGLAWLLGDVCKEPNVDDEDTLQAGDLLRVDLLKARPSLDWYDFHGTHDPAPMGGFEHTPCAVAQPQPPGASTTVFNEASFRRDHGAYWDNAEEFVLPVARLIETASPATPTSRLYDDAWIAAGRARRHARVRALNRTRIAVAAATAFALLIVGPLNPFVDRQLGRDPANVESVGRDVYATAAEWATPLADLNRTTVAWFNLPDSPGSAAALFGLLLVAAAFILVGRAVNRTWRGWDRFLQRRFLAAQVHWPNQVQLYGALTLCIVASLLLVFFTSTGWWPLVWASFGLLAGAVAWQVVAVSILGRRRTG